MIPLNWWKTARFIVETANEKTVISWRRSMLGDNGEGCLIVQLNGYGCTWSMQWAKEFGFIDKFNQATLSWFNLNKPELLTIINRKIAALEEFSISKGESDVDGAGVEVCSAEIS